MSKCKVIAIANQKVVLVKIYKQVMGSGNCRSLFVFYVVVFGIILLYLHEFGVIISLTHND